MNLPVAPTAKQRGVLKGIITAAGLIIILMLWFILYPPFDLNIEDTGPARIEFALQVSTLVLICLVIAIGRLAKHRFVTPEDIDGGGLSDGTETAKVLQSLLQNTLEQAVLALGVYIIWAVTMPLAWQQVILLAGILFLVGRALFFRGYQGGAPARALGFALTFYPSVLMLVLIVLQLLTRYN